MRDGTCVRCMRGDLREGIGEKRAVRELRGDTKGA